MTASSIKKIGPAAKVDDAFDIIDRDGAVIISGLLNDGDVHKLYREINPYLDQAEFCKGLFYGRRTKRAHSLIVKSETYRKLVTESVIVGLMNRILGPYCEKIQINVTQAIQICPGETAQVLHRDDLKYPVQKRACEFMANVMWACDPFTKENGCTRVAMGSHKWEDPKRKATENEISYAEMQPGEAMVYLGSVIHGGGENRSSSSRLGIIAGYCLGWIRQTENQYLVAPPAIAKHFPSELQDLLGYAIHRPNLGMYEGNEPKILLQDPSDKPLATRDWLTSEQDTIVENYHSNLRKTA